MSHCNCYGLSVRQELVWVIYERVDLQLDVFYASYLSKCMQSADKGSMI